MRGSVRSHQHADERLFSRMNHRSYLTPKYSCKHDTTIAAKPRPKSACLLQRSLGSASRAVPKFPSRSHFSIELPCAGFVGNASSSESPSICSIQADEPPIYDHVKSISVTTHHALSSGHQIFGDRYLQSISEKVVSTSPTVPWNKNRSRCGTENIAPSLSPIRTSP